MRTLLIAAFASIALEVQIIPVSSRAPMQTRIPGPGGFGTGGSGGGSGPTLVASVCWPSASGGGGGTSSAIDTTGATYVQFLIASANGGAGVSSPTDSKGNSWTLELNPGLNPPDIQLVNTTSAPVVGSSHTFTVTGSGQSMGACVLAWSGVPSTGNYEGASSGNNTTATTVQGGSVTPGSGSQIVVSGLAVYSTTCNSPAINGGFSAPIGIGGVSGQAIGMFVSYLLQTGSTAQNPVWTCGSSTVISAINIAQKG